MQTNKIAIIDFPINGYLQEGQIDIIKVRRSLTFTERILKKIPLFSKYITNSWSIKDWENNCNHYDLIILFDTFVNYNEYALKLERVASPSTRLILYMWNPCSFSDGYKLLSDRWEVWSFSKDDAEKYNLMYAESFFNEGFVSKLNVTGIKTDVFFIGTEKGRKSTLDEINNILKKNKISTDIKIVDNSKSIYNKKYSRGVSYPDMLKLVSTSKCLLEVTQASQTGLTQRTLESLFFKKKLITSNKLIMTCPFYNKQNCFVIGVDSWDKIYEFVNSDYEPISDTVLKNYTFDAWLQRILNKQQFQMA